MWVFPGGKIDAEDYPTADDVDGAARAAAARETEEEAGLSVSAEEFVQIAHWTPPPGPRNVLRLGSLLRMSVVIRPLPLMTAK
ncbi:MAG: hypothetical protein CM15mP120_20400 [Pseudomonadota bacterium]|nr:MAG: hypothetical protein CM15mP120_20400 [Pseudomonadota bacterium]